MRACYCLCSRLSWLGTHVLAQHAMVVAHRLGYATMRLDTHGTMGVARALYARLRFRLDRAPAQNAAARLAHAIGTDLGFRPRRCRSDRSPCTLAMELRLDVGGPTPGEGCHASRHA